MSEKITDEELAEELQRFGENVKLPIDRKKRQILIKKLNHFRAREKPAPPPKKPTPSRRAKRPEVRPRVEEFSSEDSETEFAGDEVATSSKLSRRKQPDNTAPSSFYSNTDTLELSPTYSRPKLRSKAKDETPASSAAPSSSGYNKPSLYPDLSRLTNKFSKRQSGGRGQFDDSVNYNAEEFTDSDPDESMYEVVNKSVNTTFTVENNHEDSSSDLINLSRYGSGLRSRVGKSAQKQSNRKYQTYMNHASPNTEDEIKEHDSKCTERKLRFSMPQETSISTCIVVLLVAFFLAITLAYVFMRRNEIGDILSSYGEKSESKDNLMLCPADKSPSDRELCYQNEEVNVALQVIRQLEDYLCNIAGQAKSNNSFDSKVANGDVKGEVRKILKKIDKKIEEKQKDKQDRYFKIILNLILHNPHWGIKVFDEKNKPAESFEAIAYLEGYPILSLWERITNSIYRIIWGLVLLLFCVVLAVVGVIVLRYHNKSVEEEQKKVYEMVENIIDIIKDQYELNQEDSNYPSYVAVQHVRDQLLPPSKRRRLMPIWNKAVKFIQENESRVRFEIQTIQGEDFEVWKWLQTFPGGSKVWQGQAFGENNSTAITLTYGPTPCLKIRNMFSPDDEDDNDWELTVQDAILEKCKGNNGVLHIHVEKSSKEGCVYMKCNTCDNAYKVYRSLHGWWFDGRLVTVKYLRLEHYHDRFPDSRRATKSLKPSNNKMSSLSQPFHRSTLEMT